MTRFHGLALDPGTVGFAVPFDQFVSIAEAAGFDTVEVPAGVLETRGPSSVRNLLDEHQLEALLVSCPWDPPPNASVPDDLFDQRLEALPRVFDLVREVGCGRLSAFFASNRPGMVPLSLEAITDRCGRMAEIADRHGLALCVELNDVDVLRNAAAVLAAVPPLRLLLDTFHYFRAGLDDRWLQQLPAGSIGWVHLSGVPAGATASDLGGPRCAPGEGDQDLWPILAGVSAAGYSGALSLEVIPEPAADFDLVDYCRDLLEASRRAVSRAGAVWVPRREVLA